MNWVNIGSGSGYDLVANGLSIATPLEQIAVKTEPN